MLNIFKYGIDFDLHFRKGKYYISVKAPHEIAHYYADRRCRRSSGTSDKSLANKRATTVLQKIHADFDKKRLELDPFVEALRPYLEQSGVNVGDWYTKGVISHEFSGEDTWLWQVTGGRYDGFQQPSALGEEPLRITVEQGWALYSEFLDAETHLSLAELVTRLGYAVPKNALVHLPKEWMAEFDKLTKPVKPDHKKFIELLQDPTFSRSAMGKALLENINDMPEEPQIKVGEVPLKVTKFSDLIEPYLDSKIEAKKERTQRLKACKKVIEFCGDLPLEEYTPLHAYDLAQAMHQLDYSNAQISKMITYGRGLFKYALKNRNEHGHQYLKVQCWIDLELEDFGRKSRPYVPLTHEELCQLFSMKIAPQERVLLSILIATGMRLDEAALLTWERIRNHNGVWCFCLINDDSNTKLKNRGSHRYIPVPDVLKPIIGNGGTGRLFDYRIDVDGKAQAKASDCVMPYIRQIITDDRKVAHSLRGNFKDLVRDLGVSKEINDFITGHAQGDIAGKYGQGPSMSKRLEVMNKIIHPWF